MLNWFKKQYPFPTDLKLNLKSVVGISLGIFLFLLFFQPLSPQNPDFNNRLLILATFGAITLVLLGMFRILIPSLFPKAFLDENWTLRKEIITDFLFISSNSVAFVFFAKYVGKIPITFHIVIIIVIISICAVVTMIVINEFYFLKNQVRELRAAAHLDEEEEAATEENAEIEFESENKTEYFHLFLEQIMLIKSASNYIEVIYKDGEKVSKKLIRNTMKNTEALLAKYPAMVRCHRSCMVNKNYIQKVGKSADGLKLSIFDYPHEIHVSRPYVVKIKEALRSN